LLGANGPDAVDCSGAIIYGIRKSINSKFGDYTAEAIYENYTVPSTQLGGPGTLIFYDNTADGKTNIDHVATYEGNKTIIDPNAVSGNAAVEPASYEGNFTAKNGGQVYYGQLDWQKIFSQ
jgi:cell wall-associated NlpC family hydrolase